MYIYRVEYIDGSGPYTGLDWPGRAAMCDAHSNSPNHPAAYWIDKPPHLHNYCEYELYCGFESLDKLRSWFESKFILGMRKAGFFVYKYKIDDKLVISDGFQVCFVRDKAKIIRSMSWNYLTKAKKKVQLVS